MTFGSGDEHIYRLRTAPRRLSRAQRTVWRFRATRKPATGQLVNWWEGNVTMGFGGALFAGNTGGAEYAIGPTGKQRWVFPTGNSVWSNAAIGDDGAVYFGSLDLQVYAVDARGRLRWRRGTGNFVTSSPAIAPDGTVYVASFDGSLYALDPRTGESQWTFATDDHVYASSALAGGVVYIASTDGAVYALDQRSGRLRWRYDTGDPVRSSPVLGRAPVGDGHILYVGSANGRLYALDAERAAALVVRHHAARCCPARPQRPERVAGARWRGVYIGGEHGLIVHVPYDWCLHHRDRRCETSPGKPSRHPAGLLFVTPGGSTRPGGPRGGCRQPPPWRGSSCGARVRPSTRGCSRPLPRRS